MIRIKEETIVNDKYSRNALINYDEKDCIHNKLGSSFLKNYTFYYLKNNVLNKDSFDLALQNYKHFFENNKTLCILSILNVLIILFPLFLYLIFSIVIILPVFFLLCSLFFCMLPTRAYPLIKLFINILAGVIYLFQYTEVFLSMKGTTKNVFRSVLLKMSY
ncbi:hypothetical protein PFHG_02416 [Plasmodium falciparum HB3]|uniref:Uncharacterized protein n=1 Tax=Plasmodium falciparum (isolate HB3) TaxID=137071 RepID=A0A0L7KC66_PLAFX|nr:hypothetical protein PFHG_02416 [Plasmodium falciparum HB3]